MCMIHNEHHPYMSSCAWFIMNTIHTCHHVHDSQWTPSIHVTMCMIHNEHHPYMSPCAWFTMNTIHTCHHVHDSQWTPSIHVIMCMIHNEHHPYMSPCAWFTMNTIHTCHHVHDSQWTPSIHVIAVNDIALLHCDATSHCACDATSHCDTTACDSDRRFERRFSKIENVQVSSGAVNRDVAIDTVLHVEATRSRIKYFIYKTPHVRTRES